MKPHKKGNKTLKRKRKTEPETRSSINNITAYFAPAKKASNSIPTDNNTTMKEIQNVRMLNEDLKRRKKSITPWQKARANQRKPPGTPGI